MKKSARQQAFEILLKIEKDKAFSNLALDSAVKEYSCDSTDRAFISRLVYGVVERKITLDYVFSSYLKQNANKLKPEVLTVLRLGTYQLLFTDKIPASAAVNESVKLANNNCRYASGMINAVLRKVSQNGFSFDELSDEPEKLSVRFSVPVELINFFIYHYGVENAKSFFTKTLEEKVITIKVNTCRITVENLIDELEKENVTVKKTWLENALRIESPLPVYELESYKKGYFHVEDISSQLCVKSLSPQKNERVLDVCAAPGGKTFAIAENMENCGEVVSCDIYSQRVKLIENGAKRLGLDIVNAVSNDATVFNDDLGEFDRVLCDVPCSGLGIIGKKPEIKYKKLDDIKTLLPIQKQILTISSKYVKHGGTLVYSTCSVNPNENRKICNDFLENNPEFSTVKVEPDVKRAVDEGDYLTLLPHINDCDGFFVAKFIRK